MLSTDKKGEIICISYASLSSGPLSLSLVHLRSNIIYLCYIIIIVFNSVLHLVSSTDCRNDNLSLKSNLKTVMHMDFRAKIEKFKRF